MTIRFTKQIANLMFICFIGSFIYSANYIFVFEPMNILSLLISYLPFLSLIFYTLILLPMDAIRSLNRGKPYEKSSVFLLSLLLVFYMCLNYFHQLGTLLFYGIQCFLIIMSLVFHIRLIESMNIISEESFSQACSVIAEHGTDIFFESKQTKKIRQVKFWLLVIVLAAISVDSLLVYLTLGSYTLLSFYECFRLSKEWKNNKLVYVLVLKYCILAVVLLCLTFPLLYFDYIPAAIFSLLFSDFPFFQIRWLVYKSKLEEINTKM